MFRTTDIGNFASLYLNGAPADAAEASPLFGDLTGLPPLLIQASGSELLFDDAQRLSQKAAQCGVRSKLSVYPGLPHVWHMAAGLIPEALAALREEADFVRSQQKP
jgi:acetyl esterase/lipase